MKGFVCALLLAALLAGMAPQPAAALKLKWGIVGAGRISWDFIKSMQNFDKNEHEIVAIASRNKTRGEQYAKKFGIRKVFNTYEQLAKDDEVNAVYIATINPYHFAAAKLMLENKKAVLCEKPMVIRPEDARELFELAKAQNTFLMEALWSKHLPAFTKVTELIQRGEIGELEFIQANFLLDMPEVARLTDVKFGGGIMLDVGVYGMNAVLQPLKYIRPTEVKAVGRRHSNKPSSPDRTITIGMRFPNEVVASISLSSSTPQSANRAINHVLYVGSKGYIRLPAPINAPTEIEVNGKKINTDFRDKEREYNYPNSAGLRFQAEEMRQRMLQKQITSAVVPPEETVLLAELTSEVHKQLGIEFPPTERGTEFKEIV